MAEPAVIAGRYKVLALLGVGGMGKVYKVLDQDFDSVMALKLISGPDAATPEAEARFRTEARGQHRLVHPNIVRVLAYGREPGSGEYAGLYYIMDYVEGPTVSLYLRDRGRFPLNDALEIARQVGSALAYAHDHKIVHRDIKPSNILLARDTPPLIAKLFDFGIAKETEAGESRTKSGMWVGSRRYSAPEQAGYAVDGAEVAISARTDIFGLGLLLYEMIEGRQLFAGKEDLALVRVLVYETAPLLPALSSDVPASVLALLGRALERDPRQRFPTMADMVRAIEQCLGGPSPEDEAAWRAPIPGGSRSPDGTGTGTGTGAKGNFDQRLEQLKRAQRELEAQKELAEAQAAREDAVRERAGEFAPDQYRQAEAKVTEGQVALGAGDYTAASVLGKDAAALFASAAGMARAEAERRRRDEALTGRAAAEDARQAALAVGAAEDAPTQFQRSTDRFAEGAAAFDRGAYDDAQRAFSEAQHGFFDAEQHARADRRRRAMEAGDAATAARAAAAALGPFAETQPEYPAATRSFAGGAAAYERGEDRRAQEAFTAAAAGFESATVAGRLAQATAFRDRVRARRERADAARAKAVGAQAEKFAPQSLRTADARYGDAARDEKAGAWEAAATGFEGSVQEYDAATEEAEAGAEAAVALARSEADALATLRAALEAARASAAACRSRAADEGAQEYAQPEWERAERAYRAAEEHAATGRFEAATAGFNTAAAVFENAATMAGKTVAPIAPVPATPEAEQGVAQARAAAERAKAGAEQAGAPRLATDLWKEAGRAWVDAAASERSGRLPKATTLYGSAAELFRRAEETARATAADGETKNAPIPVIPNSGAVPGVVAPEPPPKTPTGPGAASKGARLVLPLAGAALLGVLVFVLTTPSFRDWFGGGDDKAPGTQTIAAPSTVAPTSTIPPPPEVLRWLELNPKADPKTRPLQTVEFSARAAGDGGLLDNASVWSVNGQPQESRGPRFSYTPKPEEAGREVVVAVAMSAGSQKLAHEWKLLVEPSPTNAPPSIVSPATDQEITLGEGKTTFTFRVEAADADLPEDKLTYSWTRNGKAVAGVQSELSQSGLADADVIVVAVRDAAGAEATRTFRVVLKAAPNQPPRIQEARPAKKVDMTRGERKSLTVVAVDPNKADRLTYDWRLDGASRGKGAAASYSLPADLSLGTHEVEVVVMDPAGLAAAHKWAVEVRPEVLKLSGQPKSPVVLRLGESREFSVAVSGGAAKDLRFEWALDGEVQPGAGATRFVLPRGLEDGEHAVVVTATGAQADNLRVTWRVVIRPQETTSTTVTPTTRTTTTRDEEPTTTRTTSPRTSTTREEEPTTTRTSTTRPPTTTSAPPKPDGDDITLEDARGWFASYRSAWASRNAGQLVAMGEGGGDPATFRQLVEDYQGARISGERFEIEGETAVVTFTKTLIDETTGKSTGGGQRTIRLQKRGGRVVRTGS